MPKAQGEEQRQGDYNDVMVAHDEHIGQMLKKLDELGIADDTIVHVLDRQRRALQFVAGRRHHAVPLREEHQLGGRVARAGVRALAEPGSRRGRCSTASSVTRTGCRRYSRRRGSPISRPSCVKGYKAGDKTYKVHIDGFNMLPYLAGEAEGEPQASSSSTSATTATSSPFAWATGKSF